MSDDRAIIDAIDDIVRQTLSSERINDVKVQGDWDSDGEPILRITVVFEVTPSRRDAEKMMRLIGDLRSYLRKVQSDDFPIVSFISKKEAEKMQFAAA